MDGKLKRSVDEAESDVLDGRIVEGKTLLRFLELDPESEECAYLGEAAKAVSMKITKGYGQLNSSIGVDSAPCPMDCAFCSLGSKWGIVNEDILMRIELFRKMGVKGTCSMRRKNVPGTPKEHLPEVSDKRMAQIAAVLRMTDGKWNVSTSPIIPQSLMWGANSISVETGASPRRDVPDVGVWRIMSHEEAIAVLENAGFKVRIW